MLILASAYLAPVQYYTKLISTEEKVVDCGEHFVKQSYRNRCQILGAQGIEPLIVPVEHTMPSGLHHTPMCDVKISQHEAAWQRHHWHALQTAYEGSPFFTYYADYLIPLYERSFRYLCDWNEALQRTICQLLDITPDWQISQTFVFSSDSDKDFRQAIRPKKPLIDNDFHPLPYWQLRTPPPLFTPNLSIIDLLFNQGPESRLYLRQCITRSQSFLVHNGMTGRNR